MTLQNGFAINFQVTLLFSMRTESLASSQSGRSVDADAWCKQALMKALWWTQRRREKTLSRDPRDVRWHSPAAANTKEKLNSLQVQAATKTIEFSRNTQSWQHWHYCFNGNKLEVADSWVSFHANWHLPWYLLFILKWLISLSYLFSNISNTEMLTQWRIQGGRLRYAPHYGPNFS